MTTFPPLSDSVKRPLPPIITGFAFLLLTSTTTGLRNSFQLGSSEREQRKIRTTTGPLETLDQVLSRMRLGGPGSCCHCADPNAGGALLVNRFTCRFNPV